MEDFEWQGLYRIGALAFVAAGALFVVGILFAVTANPFLETSASVLAQLARQPLPLAAAALSFGIADLLLLPAILTLYVVLRHTNKPGAAVATTWLWLAITLDLVSQGASLSLLGLSAGFDGVMNEAGRAAYAAAAEGILGSQRWGGSLTNFLWGFFAVLVGWAMLRSPFGRPVGYLGIVSGFLGMIGCWFFITGSLGTIQLVLGGLLILAIVLWAAWYFLIAAKLYGWEPGQPAGRS